MAGSTTDLPGLPDPEIHHEHRDVSGGWLRPTVFGMMDGLVSNFALIAGVAGAHASTASVVALAGLGRAGRRRLLDGDRRVRLGAEPERVDARRDRGRAPRAARTTPRPNCVELTQMYIARGVEPVLAEQVARQLSRDPEQALLIHAQEELGVDPSKLPSPWIAACSSLLSFSVGAFIPLLPYLLGATNVVGLRRARRGCAVRGRRDHGAIHGARLALRRQSPARPGRGRRGRAPSASASCSTCRPARACSCGPTGRSLGCER